MSPWSVQFVSGLLARHAGNLSTILAGFDKEVAYAFEHALTMRAHDLLSYEDRRHAKLRIQREGTNDRDTGRVWVGVDAAGAPAPAVETGNPN